MAAVAVASAYASACADSPTFDPPIGLPARVPSDGGKDADAAGTDAGPADSSPADASKCTTNGAKDGAETDVDCGGSDCPPCANGRACAVRSDCASLVCAALTCSGDVGCSDATREGFTAVATFPNIAACAGGWSLPGLLAAATNTPACLRVSGKDSPNATGAGCNVADLCQVGWHVCATAAEVGAQSGAGCAAAATAGSFFVTRQSGPGGAVCGAGGNDIFGCGAIGIAPDANTCGQLNRFSNDLCGALTADWSCGADGLQEANNVTKTSSTGGGVLCCRD
jgi:hypothetical protein